MKLININLETINQYYLDDSKDTCKAKVQLRNMITADPLA